MRRLGILGLAVLASIALYLGVFSVVHRPLTLGDIPRQLAFKLDHARQITGRKLVLFAGSNGRYSHRCDDIAAPLSLPCVNMSIGVGIGLDFLVDQLWRVLRPGDVVYMPLEYRQYTVSTSEMNAGLQNATLVHDLRDQLWRLPAARIAQAYGYFDLSFLINGLAEMALDRRGFKRRTSLDSLTPQGDEQGHTAEAARAYAEFLRSARYGEVDVPAQADAQQVLRRFLVDAKARGITVVGGLPTIPDDVALDAQPVDRIRALFEGAGQRMLVLPNRSQYPLDCFYDTLSHLHEGCQRRHSARVGAALAALLDGADAPAPH